MRIFIIILIQFLLAFQSHAQDIREKSASSAGKNTDEFVLHVGYFEFPGLTHTDENGKPAGFVNEITIKTLENANIRYTIESYPAARFYQYLSKGKVHLFNGLSTIPIVSQTTISSTIELFPLEMRVYWTGNKKPVAAKEDLAGHSVILVRGFTYKDWGAWIRDKKNNVEFFDANTHEAAFKMLQKERAEYLLNYKYIDTDILTQVDIPDLVAKPLYRWYCYFNIHKETPGAEALLKKIEDSYRELIQEGRLKKYE